MGMELPTKRHVRNAYDAQWNKLLDYVRSITVRTFLNGEVDWTPLGTHLRGKPGGGELPGTIQVTACDPNTGDVVTYILFGRKVS